MNKRTTHFPKKIAILTLSIVLFLLLGLFGYNYFAPEPIRIAEITSSGTVSLSLSPSNLVLKSGEEINMSLYVSSGNDKVSVVKFEIDYDPTKLQITNLSPGSWLTQPLANPTINNGKISGILGAKPDPNIPSGGDELNRSGTGVLLTFKVKPLKIGVHNLTFNLGETEALTTSNTSSTPNMLKEAVGDQFVVKPLGDLVGDNRKVDAFDYNEFLSQYGKSGTADYNKSGKVDGYDYNTFLADYGKTW